MKVAIVKWAALALFVAVMTTGNWLLHRQNAMLAAHAPDTSRTREELEELRAGNARLRAIVVQAKQDQSAAAAAIHAEVANLRAEVAALEQRAVRRRAEMLAAVAQDEAALATNRDPTKGLVTLENLSNCGQATPDSALQTLVWATLHGDEQTISQVLVLSRAARSKAERLIASLPPEAQPQWTADKIATLALTDLVTQLNAIQIQGEALNGDHATLELRIPGTREPHPVEFQLAASGWQFVLPDSTIDMVRKKLSQP